MLCKLNLLHITLYCADTLSNKISTPDKPHTPFLEKLALNTLTQQNYDWKPLRIDVNWLCTHRDYPCCECCHNEPPLDTTVADRDVKG
jgi:hypothetical protein